MSSTKMAKACCTGPPSATTDGPAGSVPRLHGVMIPPRLQMSYLLAR